MKPKKPSAADRTVDIFAAPPPPVDIKSTEVEAVEEAEKAERTTLEADVDKLRAKAFQGQEWVSKAFANTEQDESTFRVSKKGDLYYVESLNKAPGSRTAYGYVGVMVHERDLMNLTAVLVQAVRAKQAESGKAAEAK